MNSLFLFVSEVMFERVDKMKKVIEHPMSPRGRESSIFALCSPSKEADSNIPVRRIGTWMPPSLGHSALQAYAYRESVMGRKAVAN
jgi:hypothetical protein